MSARWATPRRWAAAMPRSRAATATCTRARSRPRPALAVDRRRGTGRGRRGRFRRAQEALATGDFRGAADLFATFRETYPGSPLEAAALLGAGQGAEQAWRHRAKRPAPISIPFPAIRNAEVAPEALFLLGKSLGEIGSVQEACVTLKEVAVRYPGASGRAGRTGRDQLACLPVRGRIGRMRR